MSNPDKKTPGRPRSLQSDQAILQATIELLAEVGFEKMSIEAIADRARVGKTTIYRRYSSKEELVVDAIESIPEEIVIPNTGNIQGDIDTLIHNAAHSTLSSLGRQILAMTISSTASNTKFAQIYCTKYLEPHRKAFTVVVERAKTRNEIPADLEPDLAFDTLSAIMLYALIFQPTAESWSNHVHRALNLLFSLQIS